MGAFGTRLFNNIDWRLAIYLLLIPIIILYSLVLAGCTASSPVIDQLFLVQLNAGDGSAFEMRIGYFGMCSTNNHAHACTPTIGATQKQLVAHLDLAPADLSAEKASPEVSTTILQLGLALQSRMLLCLFLVAAIVFGAALVPLALLKRGLKKAGNAKSTKRLDTLRRALLAMLCLSCTLSILTALSINQSTVAMEFLGSTLGGSYYISAGRSLIALQWTVAALSVLFTAGITMIVAKADGGMVNAGFMGGKSQIDPASSDPPLPQPAPAPPPPFS